MKTLECPYCAVSLHGGEEVYFSDDGEVCCCTYCVDDYYHSKFSEWEAEQPKDTAANVLYDDRKEILRDYERSVL